MVKKHKIWLILLTSVVSALLISMNLLNNATQSNERKKDVKLIFGDNFISYVIENNEGMSFNIFGVQDIRKQDSSLEDKVTSITFNNPNIKVVDFKVDTGISQKGYKLINVLVTVKVSTNSVEKADKMLIQFNNEKTKAHKIGEITLQSSVPFQRDHLAPSGDYKVGYPTPALDVNIKNIAKESIPVSRINDLTEDFSHQFQDIIKIEPGEVKNIIINPLNAKNEHDFITITPILSYSLNNKEYRYNMPGVIYGILDSDQDKIKKIINY